MSVPTLLPYQARWVEDRARLKVHEKGRRIGLSWGEAYDSVLHAGAGHGDVYYQSYAHDMTRGFIDDCAQWARDLQLAAEAVGETLIDVDGEKIPAFKLPFASGKSITAVTSAPRAFRSKGRPGDRAILDEAAFVDDLAECLKAALAFLTWGGSVHVISTHNGEGSLFTTLVEDIREGRRPGSVHRTTFRDAVAEGLYRRICAVNGQPSTAEGEEAFIDGIYATYGEGAAEELDCVPSTAGGSWLPWELIRGCEHDDAGRPELYGRHPTYIGNDIGRRRDLWVAWVVEIVSGVAWTREISELRGASFAAHDAELDRLVDIYRPVRVAMDQTGMGEKPVEDAMRRYGEHRVDGVLLTGPRRLDLATALKERYQDRLWRAPGRKEVRDDLHSVKREPGTTGTPRLVADESRRESHADRFWAAALAAGAAADPPPKYEYTPARRPARTHRRRRRADDDDRAPVRDALSDFAGRGGFGRGLF